MSEKYQCARCSANKDGEDLLYTSGGKLLCHECYEKNDQKFKAHDLVKVDDVLPGFMSHFSGAGKLAIIIGSYRDIYGCGPEDNPAPGYCLLFEDENVVAWYREGVLSPATKKETFSLSNEKIDEAFKESKRLSDEYNLLIDKGRRINDN